MSMSQAEIDALLSGAVSIGTVENKDSGDLNNTEKQHGEMETGNLREEDLGEYLLFQELDTISEIGNITMGSASTPLSELLGVPVNISNPNSFIAYQEKVFSSFDTPYITIQVDFTRGLKGFNVLVIREYDVAVIADLMMGGDGRPEKIEVDELAISAASEAMNQMNGAAATALSDMFNEIIEITPPRTVYVKDLVKADHHPLPTDEPVVVVQFKLSIGDLLNTTIMQLTGIETAKEQVAYLFRKMGIEPPREAQASEDPVSSPEVGPVAEAPATALTEKVGFAPAGQALDVAMNIPLEVSLVSGRINCRVADIASLKPGMLIDVPRAGGEVEMVVNGTVVAVGELSDGRFKVKYLVNPSLKG
ncbi:MAG: flagellar motor switch phosphatase FliY [Bacillota bacterium]